MVENGTLSTCLRFGRKGAVLGAQLGDGKAAAIGDFWVGWEAQEPKFTWDVRRSYRPRPSLVLSLLRGISWAAIPGVILSRREAPEPFV
jgi:hypothetical protein